MSSIRFLAPAPRPRSLGRASIIAALLVALVAVAGCSVLKIGYGQGSWLAYRWLDGFADFDEAQGRRARAALDELLAWHRRTQLADYADVLARMEAELPADTTPERLCRWVGEVRTRVDRVFEHALPAMVEIAPTLTPRQIAHIEKRFAEKDAEYRDEFVQRDLGKRRKAALKRELDRAEKLYGELDDAQRALIARQLASSPYDAEAAYAERLAREQDTLALLRRLAAGPGGPAGRDEAIAQIRAFAERLEHSPRPAYRAYAERLVEHNCRFAAALHNGTGAAQRRTAIERLQGYEADLRELAGQAPA